MNNILFISHNLELEGATWSLFYLASGFKEKGWNVTVISPQEGPLMKEYAKKNINIKNYMNKKYNFKNKFDIIFINTILGFKFIKKMGKNELNHVIWCIRESERDIYFKKYSDLKEKYFKTVKSVIFVSEATRKIYSDLDNGNFETIHNGLDIKKIDEFIGKNSKKKLRKKYGFSIRDIIVNITGTVCLRKGQLEFTQAAIETIKKSANNQNLKFIIVGAGRGGLYERRIREIIEAAGVKDKVLLINETTRVYDYYLISDIFVCNSYIESFPRVILEAMAFSLIIIATNVYGIPEQIEPKKEGFLIMAGDVLELSQKMNFLIDNIDKFKFMGLNARKKLLREFNYIEMLENYKKVFEK